jgi:nicotinamidase-related amidase
MTALYPDESVTCDGAEGHTTTHQQQQQQQQRQQQRAHADDKGGAGQSWGSRASQVLGRGLDAAAAAGAAAGVARQLKAAAEGVRGALKQAAGALKGGACAEPDTRVEQALWPRHCVRHTRGAALHARLDVRPRDVLLRKGWQPHLDAYSAFEDNGGLLSTGLAEQLRGAGVSAVVVAGVALDYCVLWTALHAAAAGFDTAVVLQATLPVDSGAGARAAVRRLRQAGVRVVRRVSDVVGS